MGRLGDFQPTDFDAHAFEGALAKWCAPFHLECSKPFLVGWYNETREATAQGSSKIEAPDSAVAFAIYSVPGYLETVAEYFRRERPTSNFVDLATDEILEKLRRELSSNLDALVVNTDTGPPYYHVQSVGAVAGVDQHVEAKDFHGAEADEWREDLKEKLEDSRDPKMWGSEPEMLRTIFGVNVHPEWGGWYGYRALIILRGTNAKGLQRPQDLNFLEPKQAQLILAEYNLKHAECLWRDISPDHPPDKRYTTDEFFFFTEVSPAKRKRWLEMRADQLAQQDREEASKRKLFAALCALGVVAVALSFRRR